MRKHVILVGALLAMIVLGLQAVEPVAAAHPKLVDTFKVYHPNGQSSDMTVYKVYKYNTRHIYIKTFEYDKDSTGKYKYTGYHSWEDLYKFKNKKWLKMTDPNIGNNGNTIYWFNTPWNAVGFYKHIYKPSTIQRLSIVNWPNYVSYTNTGS